MNNYNVWDKRGKTGAGGSGGYRKPSFGGGSGGRDFRGGDSFDKPMFPAVCVECGERCEVPFKPTNGKPVFCRNCFRKDERPGGDRPSFQSRRDDRPQRDSRFEAPAKSSDSRNDFEQLNRKLDTIIELLKATKAQPAKETKIHTVAAETKTEAKAEEPKAAKVEAKIEEPKTAKKKTAKVAAVKADKKKKK